MLSKLLKYFLIIVFVSLLIVVAFFVGGIMALSDKAEKAYDVYEALSRNNTRAGSPVLRADWQVYIDSCQVQGGVTILDGQSGTLYTSDTADMHAATLPASTFKILNTLILLEEGAIADEHDSISWPVRYDTVKYGHRPDIYHSMPLKEAFRKSAGWAYIELSKKVGKEKYAAWLRDIGYGNDDLASEDADFWNFGPFGVSPFQQVSMLQKVHHRELPFKDKHYDILQDMMVAEKGEGYVLRAKKGWTRAGGKDTGWWVGYVEKDDKVWYFATRIMKDRDTPNPQFGSCRKSITKAILKEIGAL